MTPTPEGAWPSEEAVERTAFALWSHKLMVPTRDDLVRAWSKLSSPERNGYRQWARDALLAASPPPLPEGWRPIESAPEGEHVLLYWPHGEKGVGGIECATLWRDENDPTGLSFWTHGGPNAGLDWQPRNDEKPTHWQPLPTLPAPQPKT